MGIEASLVLALISVIVATLLLFANKEMRKRGSYNTVAFTGAIGLYCGTMMCLINVGLKYFGVL